MPGQRLNYALDFQHFDTGQLSQVVYLHNPLYTARAPPTMVEEWDSVSGPLAAFAQLHTGVQVCVRCLFVEVVCDAWLALAAFAQLHTSV